MQYFGTPEKMRTIKTVETLLTILVSLVFIVCIFYGVAKYGITGNDMLRLC